MPPTRTLKVVDFTFVDISPQFEKHGESLQEASSAARTEHLSPGVSSPWQSSTQLFQTRQKAMDTSNRIRSRAEESRTERERKHDHTILHRRAGNTGEAGCMSLCLLCHTIVLRGQSHHCGVYVCVLLEHLGRSLVSSGVSTQERTCRIIDLVQLSCLPS